MKITKIVDASAIASFLFVEPGHELVAQQIQGVARVAPPLLPLELASVYLKKVRKDPGQAPVLREQLDLLAKLAIQYQTVPLRESLDLAESQGLSVYDAQYLYLARLHSLELVTLDSQLAKAAQKRI